MNDERLEQLLRQSAGTDPTPAVPDDLADRVRRLGRSRRRRRRMLGGSAAALLLVAAAGVWHLSGRTVQMAKRSTNTPGATGVSPVPLVADGSGASRRAGTPATQNSNPVTQDIDEAEVQTLQAQIDQLRRDVARLETRIKQDAARRRLQQRLAALRRELRKPDPGDLAMAEIEKTAFLGVHRAEACEKQNRNREARSEYEQVVHLFPNTSWAKVAQSRLNKKSSEKGEK